MEPTYKTDTIRALFTYATAFIVIVGGGLALIFAPIDDANTKLVIAGMMGSAMTFAFGQETSTRTARQYAAASTNGATKVDPGTGQATPNGIKP